MSRETLITYLQDHLAGARFAVNLLQDLGGAADDEVAQLAWSVRTEVEADRDVLERLLDQLGGESSASKEAAAWLAQKAARLKLALQEPLGRFEVFEVVTLGVRGKLTLWETLRVISPRDHAFPHADYATLIARAQAQCARLEAQRIALAKEVFAEVMT